MNDEEELSNVEEVRDTIKSARDSVWVIDDVISQISNGNTFDREHKENIERNVGHLKFVTSKQYVIDSGEDISDLLEAIQRGEAKLSEYPDE